jgi:GNAT superfamily N-acetyltransferase
MCDVDRLESAVVIRRADFRSEDAQRLVEALNRELRGLYPEQAAQHFRLDPEELEEGRGAFVIATFHGAPIGCGAVRRIGDGVGEIKRMYVAPEHRGRGVARLVLEALESEARALRIGRLLLETGRRQPAAIRVYEREGFTHIPPYGEYVRSPLSVCMEKFLAP